MLRFAQHDIKSENGIALTGRLLTAGEEKTTQVGELTTEPRGADEAVAELNDSICALKKRISRHHRIREM